MGPGQLHPAKGTCPAKKKLWRRSHTAQCDILADGIDYSSDDSLSDDEAVTETEVQLRPRKTLAGEVSS